MKSLRRRTTSVLAIGFLALLMFGCSSGGGTVEAPQSTTNKDTSPAPTATKVAPPPTATSIPDPIEDSEPVVAAVEPTEVPVPEDENSVSDVEDVAPAADPEVQPTVAAT